MFPDLWCGVSTASGPAAADWLDQLSAWSSALGALLAGVAIAYAAWQAAKTQKDIVKERRLEFELGLLAEIRRQMSITQFAHLSGYVAALVRDRDDETDLAVLRAVIGVKSGPLGVRWRDELKQNPAETQTVWLKAAEDEVDEAIQRRLEK